MSEAQSEVTAFKYTNAEADPSRAKKVTNLCRSDILKAAVQEVRHGGENNLHSHPHRDQIFFVLSGRLRLYTTDDEVVAEIGRHEGVLVPRGFSYWFESVGDEVLELLQVAAADAPAELTGPFGGRKNHARRVGGRAEDRLI